MIAAATDGLRTRAAAKGAATKAARAMARYLAESDVPSGAPVGRIAIPVGWLNRCVGRQCRECGKPCPKGAGIRGWRRICSDECQAKRNAARPVSDAARAARKRAKHKRATQECDGDKINDRVVFAADGWRCYICNVICADPRDGFALTMATLEHLIPRAAGGPHRWWNVGTACFLCNSRKRDQMLYGNPKVEAALARARIDGVAYSAKNRIPYVRAQPQPQRDEICVGVPA